MNFTENVYEISETFMRNPQYVFINEREVEFVANDMKLVGKPHFPMPEVESNFKAAVLEIVAASINYCYWYGKHDVRPNNASSTKMYNLLMKAFTGYMRDTISFEESIELFIKYLSVERFPLLEERVLHLRQLNKKDVYDLIYNIYHNPHDNFSQHFTNLLEKFPGFASDIFLKRASLFFIQLYRRFGWFEEDIKNLQVPADYQVPKMLNYFRCLIYEDTLQYTIDTHQLIPKHSQMECEIRAATVLTIKMLCAATGWNVAEVDGYFFTKRHYATNPFHLTITTDY